jgi:PhzF family phenazine biosynthesis protein
VQRRFHQLDVFSATPLKGNPLAVVHAAQGLSDDTMAAFARWTNLSETTFLLPPTATAAAAGADYRVRIFTPGGELPFAGHPTLGSCFAWLAGGGQPRQPGVVVQECGVGLVRVRRSAGSGGERLAFAAPPLLRSGPLDGALLQRIAAGLQLPVQAIQQHQWVDNGPGWCAVMLASAHAVRAVQPDWSALGDIKLGLVGAWPEGDATAGAEGHGALVEVRALFASGGVRMEDPVTGSLNASLAQWLIGTGFAPPQYRASQGHALQRAGVVHVQQEGDTVWVGGDVAVCIDGHVALG